MSSTEAGPAAQAGNGIDAPAMVREEELIGLPRDEMPQPSRTRGETQVAQAAYANRPKKWPKQNQGCNQKRAMKKSFEIEPGQRWKNIMRRQPVRRPEQHRRKQRAQENGRGKVNQQSDCVFQDC